MEIIIKSYKIGSGVVDLKPGFVYVLRIKPWDANTITGVAMVNGAGYKFNISDLNGLYKLWEGPSIGSITENTDFGIKIGKELLGNSDYLPAPTKTEEFRINTKAHENQNPKVHIPISRIIHGDYKISTEDLDNTNSPYNFNYKR